MRFSPNDWKDVLEAEKPKSLFVESAWNGNSGSWQYKIAKYPKHMGEELVELLSWAKNNGIPTVFWNKEDPPHYERFIHSAKHFDYVFTSDANMIPKYKKDVGHTRIYPLPFAAQPMIHNPILKQPRNLNVCFAGTYYGDIFPERKRDMDVLLKPALDFDLDIYDRQYGMVGYETSHYRFPEIYQNAIRGRIEYSEMVHAYKRYKVFLNVNSVKDSPTMFSRRVFELLASGTVVISTYSKGIEEVIGNDVVLFAETEDETRLHLEKLLSDDYYWSRLSVNGIRRIMEYHTYNQRLSYIFEKCHLDFQPVPLPEITILSKVQNTLDLKSIEKFAVCQTYRNFELVLLNNGCSSGDVLSLKARLMTKGIKVNFTGYLENVITMIRNPFIAFISPQDYYFSNYLKDYALATNYSRNINFFGKRTYFIQKGSDVDLHSNGFEFMLVNRVPTATLMLRNTEFDASKLKNILNNQWFELDNGNEEILSLDRYNYLHVVNSQNLDPANWQKVCA